jgi:hypothetical protein
MPSTDPAAIATTTAVVSGPAGEYITDAFLENLAKSIQTQFGFLPRTVDGSGPFYTADQLAAVEGIGQAVYVLPNGQEFPFAQYAMFLAPLLDESMQHSPLALAQWQPSSPLVDRQDNRFIFRINAYDASHVPQLSDVKARVADDYKLAAAYDLALTAARASLLQAQKLGLAAAVAPTGRSIIATEPFNPSDINTDSNKSPSIPPLNLRPDSAKLLSQASQSLMTAPLAPDGKPVVMAELYPDAMAAVVELKSARPLWPPHSAGPLEGQIIYDATSGLEKELQSNFCDYTSVAARVNFKPQENGG